MSTYRGNDDCTDILLDFIASRESATGGDGNYNAVIGDVNSTEDLSRYSLDTLLEGIMPRLLERGMPSTAVGRYQIIRETLQGLMRSRQNWTGDTLFTNTLQDEMAVALMVGRGYSSWWNGEIDDEEFLHRLSCEWASLPDPRNGGRSHYDGIAGNHAGHSLDHALAEIARAKAAKSA